MHPHPPSAEESAEAPVRSSALPPVTVRENSVSQTPGSGCTGSRLSIWVLEPRAQHHIPFCYSSSDLAFQSLSLPPVRQAAAGTHPGLCVGAALPRMAPEACPATSQALCPVQQDLTPKAACSGRVVSWGGWDAGGGWGGAKGAGGHSPGLTTSCPQCGTPHGQHLPAGRSPPACSCCSGNGRVAVPAAEGASVGTPPGRVAGSGGGNEDLSAAVAPRTSPAPCPAQQGCWSRWYWTEGAPQVCVGAEALRGPAAVSCFTSYRWRLA